MILAFILIGISLIALFCYCCCVVASRTDNKQIELRKDD